MALNLYDRYLMPRLIDACCGLPAIQAHRARLLPLARGAVLEIGIGTGRNLPFYDGTRITMLHGLDPAAQMQRTAARRARAAGLTVQLIPLSAQQIPAPDAHYDTVVCTFTLCTLPDPVAALHEMRRVLAPGGRLLFCEHGRAPEPSVQRWQDRLTPWWKPLAGGCHLNRDVRAMLRDGGFAPTAIDSGYIAGPRPFAHITRGVAVAA